jgi:glutaryl-CoA dehydrogenase
MPHDLRQTTSPSQQARAQTAPFNRGDTFYIESKLIKEERKPPAQNQLIQKKLTDLQAEISRGLLGALRLGHVMDERTAPAELISLMKRKNYGEALAITREVRDMYGGNCVSDEFGVIRYVINLEAVNTHEGNHDVRAMILDCVQTRLQALY